MWLLLQRISRKKAGAFVIYTTMLLHFKEFIYPTPLLSHPFAKKKGKLISFSDWFTEGDVGEHAGPPCPKCGNAMILRTARNGKTAGSQFYGCSKFPACKGTMAAAASGQPQRWSKGQPSFSQQQIDATKNPIQAAKSWIYAKVVGPVHTYEPSQGRVDPYPVPVGKEIAVSKQLDGTWKFIVLDQTFGGSNGKRKVGLIPADSVKTSIQSFRDAFNQPIKAKGIPTINDLNSQLEGSKQAFAKSNQIPDEYMSEEQKGIDQKFEALLKNPRQSHMVINALAGTGKTTILKHLAWKYGSPEQKWLYLVFNTKNKVEAQEKFPPFVQVRTTNGFLGEVLQDKANVTKMPQTERMINLAQFKGNGEEGNAKLEKARLVVDGPEFAGIMEKHGIPNKQVGYDDYGKISKTINSLLNSIKYSFKEQVLTLVGLSKSFALDPRNQEALDKGLEKILDKYDFDTELSDVKERINKYDGSFRDTVLQTLEDLMGYDFFTKDYSDEIVDATKWMLKATLPHGINMKYQHGNTKHDLGNFRDFNDDLWYAAIHGEIEWPKYNVVLADEVQDFNEAQKIMLKKLHDAGARIVCVGDPNQGIYRFRGADSDAFSNIENQLKDVSDDKNITHNLSSNFRSRKAILDFANSESHVKNLKQGKKFKDNYEGHVTKNEVQYEDAFSNLKSEREEYGTNKETAFISRTNEPLVHAALKLLADGVPFMIVGKDIAKDLKKHIGKILARFGLTEHDDVGRLSEKLEVFSTGEAEAHEGSAAKKAYLQELEEVTKALSAAIGQFSTETADSGSSNIALFKRWLSQRLGGLDVQENEKDLAAYKEKMEKENPVVLTTAHKSKGLEFERVYVLRYDQFPHKKAKRPEDLAQEENARYVTLTRAQDELHIIDPKSQPGVKKKND